MTKDEDGSPGRAGRPKGVKGSRLDAHVRGLRRLTLQGYSCAHLSAWVMRTHGIRIRERSMRHFIASRDLRRPRRVKTPRQETRRGVVGDQAVAGATPMEDRPLNPGLATDTAPRRRTWEDEIPDVRGDKLGFDPDSIVLKDLPVKRVDPKVEESRRRFLEAMARNVED